MFFPDAGRKRECSGFYHYPVLLSFLKAPFLRYWLNRSRMFVYTNALDQTLMFHEYI